MGQKVGKNLNQMIQLTPVSKDLVDTYITVGIKSYEQHYLHLWKNQDPTPYISTSFTPEVLRQELEDDNVENFLVKVDTRSIGIVKLAKNKSLDDYHASSSLLIQKIYLLHEFSGKGYGHQLIKTLESYAKALGKNLIWLDTMQKGPALDFYLQNGFSIHKAIELNLPDAIPEEKPMWILTKEL